MIVPTKSEIVIAQNSFEIISACVTIPIAAGINKSGKYLRCKNTALSKDSKLDFFIIKNRSNKSIPITGPGTISPKSFTKHSPRN